MRFRQVESASSIRTSGICALAGCALIAGAASLGAAEPDWTLLNRTNPLQFVATGKVVTVRSAADWEKRRASIKQAMQEVMGPFPGKENRCQLDVRVEEEVDAG